MIEMTPITKTIEQWSEFYNKNKRLSYNYPELALILDIIADALGSLDDNSDEVLTICFTKEETDIISRN